MNTPNDSDICAASAAADLFEVPHQVTGSHLARVAQLFADHRCKEKDEREARAADGWKDASRATWWIAMLALRQREVDNKPQVGDWAVESTHLVGLRKHSLGFDHAIGKVVSIEPLNCYVLECRDGKTQRWENAYFIKLPQPAEAQKANEPAV